MNPSQIRELLLQSLEHERGGMLLYRTAHGCALDERLCAEWEKYFDHVEKHVAVLTRVCIALGLDPGEPTPGCEAVRHLANSLAVAMQRAIAAGEPQAAQLVACECVVLARTRGRAYWELLCECSKVLGGAAGRVLAEGCTGIMQAEDEHLHRATDWCRALWRRSLGLETTVPGEDGHASDKIEAGRAVRLDHGAR